MASRIFLPSFQCEYKKSFIFATGSRINWRTVLFCGRALFLNGFYLPSSRNIHMCSGFVQKRAQKRCDWVLQEVCLYTIFRDGKKTVSD